MDRIIEALEQMRDADNMLDYDTAMFKALDALNEYVEELEKNKPFLKERLS